MYPHERSLVEKYADKNFTIFGINSDKDIPKLKKRMEEEKITWPVLYDGGSTNGPVAQQFKVHGWPTVYLIDAKGIVRWKSVGVDEKVLDQQIEKLMKQTPSTQPSSTAKPGQ